VYQNYGTIQIRFNFLPILHMISKEILTTILKGQKKSTADIVIYTKKALEQKLPLQEYLVQEAIVDEDTLYTKTAEALGLPLAPLTGDKIDKSILEMIPAPLAETHYVVAYEITKEEIHLAMTDPNDIQTIEFIHRKTGLTPVISLTTPTAMKRVLRQYHDDLKKDIALPKLTEKQLRDPIALKKIAEELPIINIVKSILEHAVFEEASDIHIEPTDSAVNVRYRVDGILKHMMSLPKTVQSGINARIKILSSLKIDEHMAPQDGRFKIDMHDDRFAFRVSIMPVYNGEKIVMRLLHEGQKPLPLERLGFLKGPQKLVNDAIKKPHGVVLVTGPTGSGKTTTLYSVLGLLNKPEVNISTIEDPIEYHVAGINQSQTNPKAGFTFANGLRAFLRQDPDIIMVGEIRDEETAEIAIHAAMTGHLVLSTLHTNDAPTTLPRLLDMGIPPFLVAFTTNIIIAQRLVRRICNNCKKEVKINESELDELTHSVSGLNIQKLFKDNDIRLGTKEKEVKSITFYRGEGCSRCSLTGYKGRLGIYEVLEVTPTIETLINARATTEDIRKQARTEGMIVMLEDGMVKAKQGVTTIEEVLRVTRE
jgi:type IV pilus assembly protein PilB